MVCVDMFLLTGLNSIYIEFFLSAVLQRKGLIGGLKQWKVPVKATPHLKANDQQ